MNLCVCHVEHWHFLCLRAHHRYVAYLAYSNLAVHGNTIVFTCFVSVYTITGGLFMSSLVVRCTLHG